MPINSTRNIVLGELRAQVVVDNFKKKQTLTKTDVYNFLDHYNAETGKPQTDKSKLKKDEQTGQWAGVIAKKYITRRALSLWRANPVNQTEQTKDINDAAFIETHLNDGQWPDLGVIEHPDFGQGLIAKSVLPKNRVVCDYHGKFLSKSQLKKVKENAEKGLEKNEFLLQYNNVIINASEPNPNQPWGS